MPRIGTTKARPARKRPGIEALEARDLLANLPLPAIPSGARILNLPAVSYALNHLYGPSTSVTEANGTVIPTPQPTIHEVHREFFELKAAANYTVTAPRFVSGQAGAPGQSETIHASGVFGSSNQFLVGRPQLILFPSTDPSMPATGIIHVISSNFLLSGAAIILDLTEAPLNASGQVDPNGLNPTTGAIVPGDHFQRSATGLPEVFTWTLDPTSGSVYTGSTGNTPNPAYAAIVNPIYAEAAASGTTPVLPSDLPPQTIPGPTGSGTGAGYFNLYYLPDAHPKSDTTGSGDVRITAMGLTNVPGINNTAAENFS